MIENIAWLGHASFCLETASRIYIDPWRVSADYPPADVILISHEHYDHFSPSDIERLFTGRTRIIANQRVANQLSDTCKVTVLRPWQSINIGAINIKATPAYTFDDHHPATREDLGFVIAADHYDIYYAGDTDFTPDLEMLRCDIAILPVGAKQGMMTVEETVAFANSLQAPLVIPSHYGTPEGGTLLDAKALETALGSSVKVVFPRAIA